MKLLALAASLTSLFIISAAHADGKKGHDLYADCQSLIRVLDGDKTSDMYKVGRCSGVITGVAGTMESFKDFNNSTLKACFPRGTTQADLIKVVNEYFEKHPEQRDFPEEVNVIIAFSTAYPCPKA